MTNQTNLDLSVLRAVARLSRTRRAVDCESIALRVRGSLEDVSASLGRLSRASLLERSKGVRLTMVGLAVAVASGGAIVRQTKRQHTALATSRRAA
jgi:RIO-like serine/threonine protein kinase